eukprot:TRINITY_DN1725_c0_g2_i14.p2 TRINITY_DN1725_c0_g2~~TRINITY_DN1725_c0_g2_i14.p2  ORF type:complete len:232 (+),score=1.00 TRINITY_DN1725_c0_g2_i14:603-1298(+)
MSLRGVAQIYLWMQNCSKNLFPRPLSTASHLQKEAIKGKVSCTSFFSLIRNHLPPPRPVKVLLKATWNCTRSILFIAVFVFLIRGTLCMYQKITNKTDPMIAFWGGGIPNLATLIETPARLKELAIFALPRFFDATWKLLKLKGWVSPIPHAENVIFGIAMGMIFYYFQNDKAAFKGAYYSFLKKFWGINQNGHTLENPDGLNLEQKSSHGDLTILQNATGVQHKIPFVNI